MDITANEVADLNIPKDDLPFIAFFPKGSTIHQSMRVTYDTSEHALGSNAKIILNNLAAWLSEHSDAYQKYFINQKAFVY